MRVFVADFTSSENILPVKMEPNIIYEDDDLLVINKPPMLPVHPSQGNFENTLANGLAYYFKEKNMPFVFRAVNRLDRDTTGIMVVAKNPYSSCILSQQTKNKELRREYVAICSGIIDGQGTINAPIARVNGSTIERCVDFSAGESAVTHYKRICCGKIDGLDFSLVGLQLETGRTHQIRVHLKHIGCPIIGDFVYNADFSMIKRQALHSCKVTFIHPTSNKKLTFSAPMYDDMQSIADKLSKK